MEDNSEHQKNQYNSDRLDMTLPQDSTSIKQHPTKQSSPIIKKLVIIFIVIAVIGLGFVGWQLLSSSSSDSENVIATENSSNTTQDASSSNQDVPPVSSLEDYKASHPRVSFEHPSTWTVTEGSFGEGTRIESPMFSYTTAEGIETNGYFRIYMRQGARKDIDSTYIGRGVAAKATETLLYSNPAADQRASTALSFMGLDTADNFGYFFITSDFVLNVGDTLGPNYGTEPSTYIIIGGYSSPELEDDIDMNSVSLEYFDTTEAYKQAKDIIESLQVF